MHTTYHSQYKEEKSALIILNLPLWDFSKGLKNEFETAVVDEPSVFEPLKFYCIKTFTFINGKHLHKLAKRNIQCLCKTVYENQAAKMRRLICALAV